MLIGREEHSAVMCACERSHSWPSCGPGALVTVLYGARSLGEAGEVRRELARHNCGPSEYRARIEPTKEAERTASCASSGQRPQVVAAEMRAPMWSSPCVSMHLSRSQEVRLIDLARLQSRAIVLAGVLLAVRAAVRAAHSLGA